MSEDACGQKTVMRVELVEMQTKLLWPYEYIQD